MNADSRMGFNLTKMIAIIVSLSLLAIGCYCGDLPMESSSFAAEPICDVQARIDEGCSRQVPHAKSLLQCLSLCLSDIDCMGASQDGSGMCYQHDVVCPRIRGCTSVDTSHRYLARHCVRSYWNFSKQACNCDNAMYGDRCMLYPRDCQALLDNGYPKGRHWMYADTDGDGENPITMYCQINPTNGNILVRIFENTGSLDFNKTWAEYRDGFVYDDTNYWAGLRVWHAMSNLGCTRAVFAVFFDYPTKTIRYRRYYNFVVSNEDDKYAFTFGSSQRYSAGDIPGPFSAFGECFEPLENVPFSTWDSDNDGVAGENCAGRNGNGWWYSGTCDNPCNALGWGFDYLNIKESYELMTILQIRFDILTRFETVSYTSLYIDDC